MNQPEELSSDAPLLWSPGTGRRVWATLTAAARGDVQALEVLLREDAALVRASFAYKSPLYFAVRGNHRPAVEYLLDHGAKPTDIGGDDLFQTASDRGFTDLAAFLRQAFHQRFNISDRGEPAADCIRRRDLPALDALLATDPELVHAGDRRGNKPIHWAVMTRQPDIVDRLASKGAALDAKRWDGATPIQLFNGDYHFRGGRDAPKDTGCTPADMVAHLRRRGAAGDLCVAAALGDFEWVCSLIEGDPASAARPSDYIGYYPGSGTPLGNAAVSGDLRIVKLLLEHGADPNLREEGIAPRGKALYNAVYHKHPDVVRLLLEHGANPDAPVESSADALTMAIRTGQTEAAELLAAHGASRPVNLLGYYNDLITAAAVFEANPAKANSPEALAYAAENGHDAFARLLLRHQPALPRSLDLGASVPRLTRFLLENGFDPNRRDWLGTSAVHRFAGAGDIENLGLLLEFGGDLEAADDDKASTPLAWAAREGRTEAVRFLLNRGAATSPANGPDWAQPSAWARRRGRTETLAALEGTISNA
jgi:ankyrin repeat protein